MHDPGLAAHRGERFLIRLDAVATESVVLGEHRDLRVLRRGKGCSDHVLRRVAPGAEDITVPLVPGDRVGHRRLDQQDFLVFFRDREHRQRRGRRRRPDGDVGLVVAERRSQRRLRHIRLDLVVLLDHYDPATENLHLAARGVLQAQHESGLGLFAVGFQCSGLAVDVRDPDFIRLREPGRRERSKR